MTNPLIKICGIRDPATAQQAAAMGVHFIGIVFHPLSPRYVHLEQAVAIAKATQEAGASPVAVFVNHTDLEMKPICEITKIHIVQLHGAISRRHHHLLPDDYQRIYAQTVSAQGEVEGHEGLEYLDRKRDFILLDQAPSGRGNSLKQLAFRDHYLSFPWLLAGGLSPSNVATAMKDWQPQGVDVSSGVESSIGNKDILLIQKFVAQVRGYPDAI